MIVRKHLDPKIVFRVARRRVLTLLSISTTVSVLYHYFGTTSLALDSLPASILGVALAILIGFRVNSAYERWWEARKLWGTLINDSRSISRQAMTLFSIKNVHQESEQTLYEEKKKFIHRQIAFVYALKNHLRKQEVLDLIKPFLDDYEWKLLKDQVNIPNALLLQHAKHLEALVDKGYIEDFRHMQMDIRLSSLTDAMGGCERIKNTIFPRQYSIYTTTFIAIYTYAIPFIFVNNNGWATIPFTVLIGFIFYALDSIAKGIENPFENSLNDIPMTSICKNIEINLKQMLGEKDLPEPEKPINGFLY